MEIKTNLTVDNINVDVINAKELFAEKSNIKIDVDDKIDETSENPVQNKVIAEALKTSGKVQTVNGIIPDDTGDIELPIDDDFFETSENPVKNSTIKKRNDVIDSQIQRHEFSIKDIYDALHYLKIWIISTPQDLLDLKAHYNETHPSEDERIFALQVADIDMSGIVWDGIGINGYPFRGTYNGNYYKITNLTFDATTYGENTYCGLFNQVECCDIKNLDIEFAGFQFPENCKINRAYKTLNALKADESAKVENVIYVLDLKDKEVKEENAKTYMYYWDSASSTFKAFEFGGGLVGKMVGICEQYKNVAGNWTLEEEHPDRRLNFENVTVRGTLGTSDLPCTHNTGGFIVKVGYDDNISYRKMSTVSFTNCINEADIYCTYTKCGGIIAYIACGDFKFDTVENHGNITNYCSSTKASSGGVGGFIGWTSSTYDSIPNRNNGASFNKCKNTGKINSDFLNFDNMIDCSRYQIGDYSKFTFITPFIGIPGYGFTPSISQYNREFYLTALGKYIDENTVEYVKVKDAKTPFVIEEGAKYMVNDVIDGRVWRHVTDPDKTVRRVYITNPKLRVNENNFTLDEKSVDIEGVHGTECEIVMVPAEKSKEDLGDKVYKYTWN